MRGQRLGPELMISETVATPLISASRLHSFRPASLPAQLLACRRHGPFAPSFGLVPVAPPHNDLSWRSFHTMRRILVLVLLAGLLVTCGATALAGDTPEAAGSAKTQTD